MYKTDDIVYMAALYCRLSKDDEQIGESVSIETQKMILEDYCEQNGIQIYDIYVDDGFSGLNFQRPEFMRLLDDIKKGRVNLVITKDLSRLGRDYIQTGYYTEIFFSKYRVRYIAINDGIDTEKDDNDIAPFKNILNDMYAKDISKKIKSAKYQRACKGYYISAQAPYGYKVDPLNHNHLIIDDDAAATVKEIFSLYLDGNNYTEIARILQKRRIITPSVYKVQNGDTRFYRNLNDEEEKYAWRYQTVRSILDNQMYAGDMVNHKCETINYKTKEKKIIPKEQHIIVPDCHDPIISRDVYEKVQNIMLENSFRARKNFNNVFQNIVFCNGCGKAMILISRYDKNGDSKAVFRCSNYTNHKGICPNYRSIDYDDLYKLVLGNIQNLIEQSKKNGDWEYIYNQIVEQLRQKYISTMRAKINSSLSTQRQKLRSLSKGNVFNNVNSNETLEEVYAETSRLAAHLENLERESYNVINKNISDERLHNLIYSFSIDELNEEILTLISKIEIGNTIDINGTKKQNIYVAYAFSQTK